MGEVTVRRVREYVAEGDRPAAGAVFLVDRIWPRGVPKDDVHVDGWLREVAPSDDLRKWFGHDPMKWAGFRKSYLAELAENADAAAPLVEAARSGDVLLLFDAKDVEHNQAVVLADWLRAAVS